MRGPTSDLSTVFLIAVDDLHGAEGEGDASTLQTDFVGQMPLNEEAGLEVPGKDYSDAPFNYFEWFQGATAGKFKFA